MRYLLLGYYGFKNTGDEALAEVLVRELRRSDPAAAIRLASSRQNLFHIIADINWAEVVIGGGGGLLQDTTSVRTIPFYLGLLQLAKWRGKKALMLGQGLGPLHRFISRQLVRRCLPHLNGITFRDQASADLAQKICRGKKLVSSITADLAFLLPIPGNNEKRWRLRELNITAKPKIGLAVRFPLKSTKNDWAGELAAFCDRAAADADIYFLPFHYPDDVAAAKTVAAQMQKTATVIDQVLKPAEMLGLLSAFDILVGMRLHSLIFAVKAGVPAIGIAYDPKVAAFMDACDLPCLPIETLSKEKLQTEYVKLRGNIVEIRSKLIAHAVAWEGRAAENFAFLVQILGITPFPEINMLGVRIHNLTLEEAVTTAERMIKDGSAHLITTPNPEIIVRAEKETDLRDIINNSDLRLPDGSGLLFTGNFVGKHFKERVAGIDFMLELLRRAALQGYRVYLLGGAPGIAEKAAQKLVRQNPGLKICGTVAGYFTPQDEAAVIAAIRQAKPDILFVGLGGGKQERWLSQNKGLLSVPVMMGMGGSLDVISGKLERAPKWIQDLGIEWLYRLVTQPWRWRRMLALPSFFVKVIIASWGNDKLPISNDQ